jgi:hypothetical protein
VPVEEVSYDLDKALLLFDEWHMTASLEGDQLRAWYQSRDGLGRFYGTSAIMPAGKHH